MLSTTYNIKCPSCKQEIICYDLSHSQYFVCSDCDLFFLQKDNKDGHTVKKFNSPGEVTIALELGKVGTIEGKEMRVIGIVKKRGQEDGVTWTEYLLYNPKLENYVTLVEVKGHWNIVEKAKRQDYEYYHYQNEYWIRDQKRLYSFYTSYRYDVDYALGEFDWDIIEHAEHSFTDEYILPPFILLSETNENKHGCSKRVWYEGNHIERSEIASIFNISLDQLPPKIGLGALQPNPAMQHWKPVLWFSIAMIIVVFVTQFLFVQYKPEKNLLSSELLFTPDSTISATFQKQVTDNFRVSSNANLDVILQVDVSNEWIEIPITLVNNDNGNTYDASKVIEYYYGYEGGESWREGSTEETFVFNSLPAGNYHLNIEAYAEQKRSYLGYLYVKENTILYSNLICMLILVLAYPVYLIIKRDQLEENRWN